MFDNLVYLKFEQLCFETDPASDKSVSLPKATE